MGGLGLDFFWNLSPLAAAWCCLVENILLFALAMALGTALVALFSHRRVVPPPAPVERRELVLAASCVFFNSIVTLLGWWLWKHGLITVRRELGWRVALDAAVLFLAMDLAMYVTHRIAHWAWVYPWMHRTHHGYERPRPLDLFVLNPFEVLGFGALWLGVLMLYPATWWGILIYLTLNLVFGTVGHLGVEPLPAWLTGLPVLRHLGTSTFHAGHHQDRQVNFGFYTDVWDRLFRSGRPSA